MDDGKIYITNQITIQILLLFKRHVNEEFGVRETQRLLHLNSPSTTKYHLSKLTELGLLDKTPSNLYSISKEGKEFNLIKYPIEITPQYILGKFVPKYSFLIFFILTSIIISILAFILDLGTSLDIIAINSFISLTIVVVYLMKEWIIAAQAYKEFTLD
ncbi:MAG: hypothetical protein GPJ54_18625 [Candidatus Heimdallarchaeota archaeon]|nr:hypothetical protein [Candidatus Heimdallarchaeota archaeon]